jgi:3-oxoacyl-[acyl-carrier protein] reductase
MHYDFGFGFPFEGTSFVIPKTLWDELMGQFVIEKLQIGEAGLTTQFSKIVADLVLQDTAKPASFGRFAAKVTRGPDRDKECFLDKIFCDLRSPHPKESVPVKAITMFLNPPLGINTGDDCGFRAFALGESHLLGDVSKAGEAQGIIQAAIQNYGRIDILVNNSGVYEFAPIEAITEEHFHRHFNINVLGLLFVTQAAVKYLGEGGSIINIGTVASSLTPANSAVYAGSKAAVHAITGVFSRELGPRKIRVNTLSPGVVETEGTHRGGFIGSDFEKVFLAQTPLGRIGQPGDIASIAVFLASEDSAWLTGEQLLATGGLR